MNSCKLYVLILGIFVSVTANAMPIPQFEGMSASNESSYLGSLLRGAVAGLDAHGQKEQSAKLIKLFLVDRSDKNGFAQFYSNLNTAKQLNQKKSLDPAFKPYEVENAFAVTLKDNGVTVPISFLLMVNKDFKGIKQKENEKQPPKEMSLQEYKRSMRELGQRNDILLAHIQVIQWEQQEIFDEAQSRKGHLRDGTTFVKGQGRDEFISDKTNQKLQGQQLIEAQQYYRGHDELPNHEKR